MGSLFFPEADDEAESQAAAVLRLAAEARAQVSAWTLCAATSASGNWRGA
jgi:hypothetical protein